MDLWISVGPWKPPGAGVNALRLTLYHGEVLGAVANILFAVKQYREFVGARDA